MNDKSNKYPIYIYICICIGYSTRDKILDFQDNHSNFNFSCKYIKSEKPSRQSRKEEKKTNEFFIHYWLTVIRSKHYVYRHIKDREELIFLIKNHVLHLLSQQQQHNNYHHQLILLKLITILVTCLKVF